MPLGPSDEIVYWVAANARRIRERLGMTQEELADAAGVNARHYQKIERGKMNLSVVMLAKLATALGVSPARLLRPAKLAPRKAGRPRSRT